MITKKILRWVAAAAVVAALAAGVFAFVALTASPAAGGASEPVGPRSGPVNAASLPALPLGPVAPGFTGGPPQQPNMGSKTATPSTVPSVMPSTEK